MNQQSLLFLTKLFKPGEQVCFGSNVWDTEAQYIYTREQEPNTRLKYSQFITLNPIKEKRADVNVTSFRNILLEFDKHTIKAQHKFITRNKIPFSTLTFSGSKSLHCIISLKGDGVSNDEEYRQLVNSIYLLVDPEDKWLDKSCKNPSRFTRLPGAIRPDKNKLQELVEAGSSISFDDLYRWILAHKNYPRLAKYLTNETLMRRDRNEGRLIKKITKLNSVSADELVSLINASANQAAAPIDVRANYLSRRAEAFLTYGVDENQNWRVEAMFACCDLARCGFDEDEIYERLLNVDGYLNEDSEMIPSYAIKTVLTSGEFGSRVDE